MSLFCLLPPIPKIGCFNILRGQIALLQKPYDCSWENPLPLVLDLVGDISMIIITPVGTNGVQICCHHWFTTLSAGVKYFMNPYAPYDSGSTQCSATALDFCNLYMGCVCFLEPILFSMYPWRHSQKIQPSTNIEDLQFMGIHQ